MFYSFVAKLMFDVVVIGAGAAGLMAAISAAEKFPDCKIALLDGAARIGAKILVSGGGRCNVTHHRVDETAFAGSTRPAIRKVLRKFDVDQTVSFFREIGVFLKREETGKLFPTTDNAKTVLDALLQAARQKRVRIFNPWRVNSVERKDGAFLVRGSQGELESRKLILATGGKSLPKSGSDGAGYSIARSLGHGITPDIFPALVPLTLSSGHFLLELSGLSTEATLDVRSSSGRKLQTFTGSLLCTHFGISGPVVLDISRYYESARIAGEGARLVVNWLPAKNAEQLDEIFRSSGRRSLQAVLRGELPERLARALCEYAKLDPASACAVLTREQRKGLIGVLTLLELPVTGNRGFSHAEVTAGGVPLSELNLNTMESRVCPGLFLCGEICDVDGRIGGFNFQWAWSSGYLAGVSVAL